MITLGVASLLASWIAVFLQTQAIPMLSGWLPPLHPAPWLVYALSLRFGRAYSIALAAFVGLLLDYWSTLPAGVSLIALVVSTSVVRAIASRWFPERRIISALSACTAGFVIFFAIRDALGVAAALFGSDTLWLVNSSSLRIQASTVAINAAASALFLAAALPIHSLFMRIFRTAHGAH